MIAITSISPKHANEGIQKKAVDSWAKLGMKVHSFNNNLEIQLLQSRYKNVTFIETKRTMEKAFGKPYVGISAMIDWCKEQDDEVFCLINSDIELSEDRWLLSSICDKSKESVIVANRFDYDGQKINTVQYVHGIDVFFINKKYLDIYPQSLFCMGQCFWDYFIPYTAIKNNIDVIALQNEFAFHKKHKVQYSTENWEKTGKYFAIENDLQYDSVGRMNELVYNFLSLTMKKQRL